LIEFLKGLVRFPGTSDLSLLQKLTLCFSPTVKNLILEVDYLLQTMTTAPNQVVEIESKSKK
jgi:hypothetical protein